MTDILAVFRSRTQATDCATKLRQAGVRCSLTNTPKEAGVGCGLSIQFNERDLWKVRTVLARGGYTAFYSFMSVGGVTGRPTFRTLGR